MIDLGPVTAAKVHRTYAASEKEVDLAPEDPEEEGNPFDSKDWRIVVHAWAGFAVRLFIIAGGIFTLLQYLDSKEESRVERTLQLVELWERTEYQEAQQAVAERLEALNERYAALLGANATPAERKVYMEQIGIEAMTQGGGTMSLAEFRAAFGRVLYFLNRMAFCVEGRLCSRSMVDGYFGDYARSFWDYFAGHIAQERKSGTASFAAPLESYLEAAQPPSQATR